VIERRVVVELENDFQVRESVLVETGMKRIQQEFGAQLVPWNDRKIARLGVLTRSQLTCHISLLGHFLSPPQQVRQFHNPRGGRIGIEIR
jgi:hypothetical protein